MRLLLLLLLNRGRTAYVRGHGEPLARLARDFAPSVTLFSAMARDASPRQAFVSRHCTRARYDQIPGHSRSAGASSDGSLCASQAFRRLMTAVDFLHSHAEEWAPGPTSVVLLVEPGTLLFFGEQHLRKLSMRLPQRRGVLTSLEGLGHDVRHNSGSGSAGSVPFSRCGLEHDPTLQAVAKQPHKRKATPHKPHEAAPAQPGAAAAPSAASSRVARRKGGEKPRAEERSRGARRLADAAATDHAEVALAPPLSPPPLDVGAPALLATAEGLRGLLGAAARALVRDLSLPEPNGAAWWRDPAPWFDPDAQQNDAKDFEGRKAASSSGAQDRQVESAFSGDAWAQFLADAPPSTQVVFATTRISTRMSTCIRARGTIASLLDIVCRIPCWALSVRQVFLLRSFFEVAFILPVLALSQLVLFRSTLLAAAHVRPRGRSSRAPLPRPPAPRQRLGPPRHLGGCCGICCYCVCG